MADELLHEREYIRIVSSSRQHQPVISERIFHSLGHVASCQIVHYDSLLALRSELLCQQLGCSLCIAVYRSVADAYAFSLRSVARPCIVQIDVVSEIFREDRSVQRTDHSDIESCCLLQHVLHLCAVFSYDTDIVTSCLACPVVILGIQRPELSESVC